MHRRHFLIRSSLAATATAVRWPTVARADSNQTWPKYNGALVIDGLGAPGGGSFGDRVALSAANLADVKASGLTAINVTVGGGGGYARDFEDALRNIAFWDGQIEAYPDVLMKIKTVADLAEAKKT